MSIGKLPHSRSRFRPLRITAACGVLALLALTACQAQQRPSAPPANSISADRAVGDIMVRFSAPPVITSEEAGRLLEPIAGPIRFVVKRPMSGGVWLVTAISASADATLDQAVATLRAAPRIELAEPDRVLKPNRTMPSGRDMPPS
ncbi:hypothetical protein P3W85_40350 [Cupriavidus basilensis]|uniref:Lipoprotein n=1 Tax=Cupriavidus basilensis TaxID=68895 RepID=A0ABT6B2P0_9BURK|nr:hypothetical protein [Cupriavidus basilensis]MDF3839145.1 hypothetical protein [Cupriavidus basilensis]